ncbi:Rieske (2Fe-2S) protein [Mesorhizobium sp. PAMC28654]|uniref:Rieske (2Fe-2S) protein n=1 Tax=Mesorhizobium sp. PAMC28654 TaxID=2880934 RepID=UPI001D0AB8E3|nr:Rieske (2Fe-2S) protein [Mesorhizobium sp. PAMC28654]UDL91011.1 Rieske (2Fe-2S) protein [Mesorhizobium sp. PAMC28654]
MTRHPVASISDIPDGGRLKVDVAGRSIVVFHVDGAFYALADRCPHQGGPLSQGDQIGELRATVPGQHQYCRRNMIIRCPWHHWEFDIETGQSQIDPARIKVRRFETAVGNAPSCVADDKLAATTFETVKEEGLVYVII